MRVRQEERKPVRRIVIPLEDVTRGGLLNVCAIGACYWAFATLTGKRGRQDRLGGLLKRTWHANGIGRLAVGLYSSRVF